MALPTNAQGGIDLTSLRLEAARNAGVTAAFTKRTGRQFTGSIADYGALTQREQLDVSAAMARIVKARPADFQPAVVKGLGNLDAPMPEVPGVLESLRQGAVEGLTNYPKTIGSVVNKAFTAATGGQTIGSTLNRAMLLAAGAVVLYLVISSGKLGNLIPRRRK